MPRDKQLDKVKRETIRSRYEALKAERDKKYGTPKYNDATIWAMLVEEFFLTRRTLEGIIYFRAEKKAPDNQPGLFDSIQ
jgi:hypothetical protein